MHILIISPYPPPIGGNSVHVQRLSALLTDAGHHAKVLDYKRKSKSTQPDVISLSSNPFKKAIEIFSLRSHQHPNTVVHFHVSALGRFKWVAPFLVLLFSNFPRVITIHSGSFISQMSGTFQRIYLKHLLGYFQQIITVSDEQAQYLFSVGIAKGKVTTIPAFLPQNCDLKLLPERLKGIPEHKILVLTSGYLTPIYDYDVLIDCIPELDETRYIFIFACYNKTDVTYEEYIYKRLKQYPNVIILRDQTPDVFIAIQARCDIYVRTTITDGDAVAIREALQNGKTVLATDCVTRPSECHLFSSSTELLELFHKIANGSLAPNSTSRSTPPFLEQIVGVYQSAFEHNTHS